MGKIPDRQKDRDAGEWKYLLRGETLAKREVIVTAKLSPTGKLVLITVYLE